eukprot:CAMPEP_0117773136 /NCGR_PEP_ID=MMETSP0947-20121206/25637_1 /TAXON_ID=44440 /ORGANISM="Chattonella subsalsa, Strain CCMP2191" /LENGTH=123 /DNA_ID=CAMNT_0005599143 /DNA_START=55 /DNA_END=422 /DNA_ORIENTATION=+
MGIFFAWNWKVEKLSLGAPPEQLFKVEANIITADSIAGTRPRGTGQEEDTRLEQELIDSQKDQTENSVTAQHIIQVLSDLSSQVRIHDPQILKLAHVQHIAKKIEAQVNYDEITDIADPLSLA